MSFEQTEKNSEFDGKGWARKKKNKRQNNDEDKRSRRQKKAPREKNRDWRDFLLEEEDADELIG